MTGNAVATFSPPRLPFHPAIEDRFGSIGVNKATWKALVESVYPSAKSADAVAMALSYCVARKLDPFKRPVHIVPMYDSQRREMVETVWPGISEIRTTAFRTGQYAGCDEVEFGPEKTRKFSGMVGKRGSEQKVEVDVTFPEWGRMKVYRILGGQRCCFTSPKVYWLESYGKRGASEVPNEMWAKRPSGQLEKCVEAAALRKAFPEEIGNDYTAEEMTGQVIATDVPSLPREEPPAPPPETAGAITHQERPPPAQKADAPREEIQDAEIVEQPQESQALAAAETDAESLLTEIADAFEACTSEQVADEIHGQYVDKAEEVFTRQQREQLDEMYADAVKRVQAGKGAPVETKDTKAADAPPAPPEASEDDDDGFPGDKPPAPPEPEQSPQDEHGDKMLDLLRHESATSESLKKAWATTMPERKEMIDRGEMTKAFRDALKGKFAERIAELEVAEDAGPTTAAEPAAKPAASAEPNAKEAFTAEFAEKLAACTTVAEVNDYQTSTLPRRNKLVSEAPDGVTYALWRKMVTDRRNEINGL